MNDNGWLRRAKAAFIQQQDQSHCGVACLAMIIKWYGGEPRLQRLVDLSGTDQGGISLLGLQQAAKATGMEAEGYEADIASLREAEAPCILHVIKPGNLHHFVVCWGWKDGKFLISDPGESTRWMEGNELDALWQSKHLLLVNKTTQFISAENENQQKKKWIKELLKEDYNLLGVALALGIAITFLGMAQAVFVQRLLDDIIPQKHYAKLTVGLSLLGFLLVVRAGFIFLRSKFLLKQSRDFNNRIVNHFFGSLLYLPKSFFDSRRTGDLIARLNDTLRIQNAVSYLATSLMIDALLMVMCLLFILIYSPWLFFIALLILPLFFLAARFFHTRIVTSQRELMQAYARNESHYVDVIQGIWPVKAGNRETHYTGISREIYDYFQGKVMQLGTVGMKFNVMAEIITSFIYLGVLSTGAVLALKGHFEIGGLIAVIYLVQMMLPAAARLAVVNIQLQEARVAFDRMYEFTSLLPEYDPETDKNKTVVEDFGELQIKNLSFGFPGKEPVLRDISLYVKKGGACALFGESGAGKSTLLQILQMFYAPAGGALTVNGKAWNDLSVQGWRNLIGVVPQQVRIFSGTLAENIAMDTPPQDASHWNNFLSRYGFDKQFGRHGIFLHTRIGEDGVKLSGGQQQLVALARALYRKPQFLLLDEGTAAMDRNTEDFVIQLLEKLKADMGILIISHRIRSIRNCEQIFVIADGATVVSGTHAELIKGENLYALSWSDYSA